ncbi:DUF302 domain-containing protein [Herpetosiphon giganteus]|uniref:DUF302 domain-containing protein n=1 Tax=Herpetosiphon giganteus TaxID=2029754 RepID=UPI00195EC458|nr:DUF302 domain-containing protein [Herpetosiphon giganteus]MBM7845198.1 uncharacterized protein (DUF302 family) [Herpetosiphon giganteus]
MFNEQVESLRSLHITHFTVEHVVVPSRYSFEEIITALEARVGVYGNWEIIPHQLAASKASWEDVSEKITPLIGESGFTTFVKMEQGLLLSLTGKPKRIVQYVLGNPMIGVMMIEEVPEAGLYIPPKLLVYEDYDRRAFVSYDRTASLLSQYQNEQLTQIAKLVDHKLDELAKAVTGNDIIATNDSGIN